MIQIGDKIVSMDLFDNHFICDLRKCEGNCCVFGDSGAPLEEEEVHILDSDIESIKPFMRPEGIRAVEELGSWMIDRDGDKVTPLVGKEECAYVIFENDIAWCAIEKAFINDKITFQKPISCHLYPIRVSSLNTGIALNYHKWSICEPARVLGKKEQEPVFRFLKAPITRVYGSEFYDELELAYREIVKSLEK